MEKVALGIFIGLGMVLASFLGSIKEPFIAACRAEIRMADAVEKIAARDSAVASKTKKERIDETLHDAVAGMPSHPWTRSSPHVLPLPSYNH